MPERNLTGQKLALLLLDMVALLVALDVAILLRYPPGQALAAGGPPPLREILVGYSVVALTWAAIGAALGSHGVGQSAAREASAVLRTALLTFLVVLAAAFFRGGTSYSRGMIAIFFPLVLLLVALERKLFRVVRRRALLRLGRRSKVAVMGSSREGDALIAALGEEAGAYELVGRIERSPGEAASRAAGIPAEAAVGPPSAASARHTGVGPHLVPEPGKLRSLGRSDTLPVLGSMAEIDRLCGAALFDVLVVVDVQLPRSVLLESIEACLRHEVRWNAVPGVQDLLLDRARASLVDGIPLVGMREIRLAGVNRLAKRLLDVVGSGLLLGLSAPLWALVALAIKLSSHGPVLHGRQRIGYRGRPFSLLEFRSMHVGNGDRSRRESTRPRADSRAHGGRGDPRGFEIVHDPRSFPVGRFIRRTSIDGLPRLWNVLRGDMSLVGPRPALSSEVDGHREWQRRRLEARPGITGPWLVWGRSRLSLEEVIELDIDYLQNWSFLLDLRILWRTARLVLLRDAR